MKLADMTDVQALKREKAGRHDVAMMSGSIGTLS